MADFNSVKIEQRDHFFKLFIDDTEVKGVVGVKYEASVDRYPLVTVEFYAKDVDIDLYGIEIQEG